MILIITEKCFVGKEPFNGKNKPILKTFNLKEHTEHSLCIS